MDIDDEYSLDPRIAAVIEAIEDDETRERIEDAIAVGLEEKDVLLITSVLNRFFPPNSLGDVAECLGDGQFTVIVNPVTNALEWESDSVRFAAAVAWFEGDNVFEYRPPDRVLVEAMEIDGNLIRHVVNPTEEMKLAAVRRDSSAIRYIQNPSDVVKRTADMAASAERMKALSSDHERGAMLRADMNPPIARHQARINSEREAIQLEPTSITQGIASLNVFSDLLMYLAIQFNNEINNDESKPSFTHVTEKDGGLVLSFTSMRGVFLLRDMFWEKVEKIGLDGSPGLDFEDMEVMAYPSTMGPGLITWGPAAAVARVSVTQSRH